MPQPRAGQHYATLDGLRGYAALFVALSHIWQAMEGAGFGAALAPLLDASPAHIVVNGEGAVILFFVLSGFVLTLTATIGGAGELPAYYVRRITRIWLPYAAALIAFVIGSALTYGMLNGPYKSLDAAWHSAFSPGALLLHLSLIGSLDPLQYLGVSWSLVHEMRISLAFPVLLLCLRGRVVLPIACVALLYGGRALALSDGVLQFSTALPNTIYYFGMFIPGIWLAQHRAGVARTLSRLGRMQLVGMGLLAWTLMVGDLYWPRIGFYPAVPLPEILGSMLLVALGVSLSDRMRVGPIARWLGRISYSLYLWHPLAILLLFRLLNQRLAPAALAGAVLATSLVLATLAQRWIERPAIELGRHLSARLRVDIGRRDMSKAGSPSV
jgi:peptidoglycan/LPS O-acetylase OafA/YrhL